MSHLHSGKLLLHVVFIMATMIAKASFIHFCHCLALEASEIMTLMLNPFSPISPPQPSASPRASSISPICLPPLRLNRYILTVGSQAMLIWTTVTVEIPLVPPV